MLILANVRTESDSEEESDSDSNNKEAVPRAVTKPAANQFQSNFQKSLL